MTVARGNVRRLILPALWALEQPQLTSKRRHKTNCLALLYLVGVIITFRVQGHLDRLLVSPPRPRGPSPASHPAG